MSKFEDRLWRELVRKHGADLEQMTTPADKRARRVRPRLLAGTSVALAVAVAAVALVFSAARSPSAFAVSRNADGTYTISLQKLAAIHGANAKLAALGIRAKLVEVTQGCEAKGLPPSAVHAVALARDNAGKVAPQVAVARLDPRKIPPGKVQVIPAYGAAGTVHVETGHLMKGAPPRCLSTVAAVPRCAVQPMSVLRNGHVTELTPAEAKQRAAKALATFRAGVGRPGKSASTVNSGNTGTGLNSGTTSGRIQVPTPGTNWVVGCHGHGASFAGAEVNRRRRAGRP